jgi:uncharacterized protein
MSADTTSANYSYVRDTWVAMDGVQAAAGGLILGITVSLLYMFYGRLTGISGMVEKVIKVNKEKVYQWELSYLCGIYAASYIYIQCTKEQVLQTLPLPTWVYIVGGLCVGFGTRMGCGCTSGHGLSGLARLSPRSFVAVGSFFVPAVIVANLVHGVADLEVTGDITNKEWYQSSTTGGATLLALSLIAPLRDISLQTVHVWFFGALFGIGLSLSGMTNNAVVISFLNFDKMWNPALMFVLAFGSGTFSLTYWIREYRGSTKPLYGEQNHLPTKTAIDLKLVVGSVFFGIGWGLAGLCPGPVVAVLSVPAIGTIYVPSLIAGMKITEYISALDYPVEDDSEKVDEEVNLSDTLLASDP